MPSVTYDPPLTEAEKARLRAHVADSIAENPIGQGEWVGDDYDYGEGEDGDT